MVESDEMIDMRMGDEDLVDALRRGGSEAISPRSNNRPRLSNSVST